MARDGRDPKSMDILRLDEIRACWPRFVEVNHYALDVVQEILNDKECDNKTRLTAAKIVLDRVAPERIFENLITQMLADELKQGKQSAAKKLLSVLMPDGKRIG